MGIGRARKLLGDDSLIQVQDGRIFLDDKRVFVDTWAFDEIEQVIRDTERQPPSRLRMEELGQQLIALYVGRLFDDDDSLTASAILIEQFRERFINMVTLLARALARHDLRGAMDATRADRVARGRGRRRSRAACSSSAAALPPA